MAVFSAITEEPSAGVFGGATDAEKRPLTDAGGAIGVPFFTPAPKDTRPLAGELGTLTLPTEPGATSEPPESRLAADLMALRRPAGISAERPGVAALPGAGVGGADASEPMLDLRRLLEIALRSGVGRLGRAERAAGSLTTGSVATGSATG